jgi:alkanesulfonate monooxygenase SsuD/methylene tetrahydromethanopterin reductase-like flavin-dependent oxidoreductase (luciferase family)
MSLYRETYKPSFRHPQPHGAACVWAVAGETEAAAERLFSSRAMSRLARDRGLFVPLPSPEEAARHRFTDSDRAHVERQKERAIWGTAARVGARLRALAADLDVQEIAILTTVHDPAARRRSYTLLAEEFGLAAQPGLAAEPRPAPAE